MERKKRDGKDTVKLTDAAKERQNERGPQEEIEIGDVKREQGGEGEKVSRQSGGRERQKEEK